MFEERFNGDTLPAGWLAFRLDSGTVNDNIAGDLVEGWQSVQDFKNPNARSVASPSWYNEDTIQSDSWLVTPKLTIGDNSCLSWFAYSQDRFFGEAYEVRISFTTPTPDSSGFLAQEPLLEIEEEGNSLNYRSLNMAAYAGQEVYIAFRQTSKDKFVLVLDDVRLAEVELKDIGVYALETVVMDLGDSVNFRASLRNFGSDTLSLDSTIFAVYTINGTDTVRARILDDTTFVNLSPNDTFRFSHPIQWKPEDPGTYWVCMWSEWVEDTVASNDTSCARAGVDVNFTSIASQGFTLPVMLYPNPTRDRLNLAFDAQQSPLQLQLFDALGRLLIAEEIPPATQQWKIRMDAFPEGTYILVIRDEVGRENFRSQVIKR